MDNKKTSFWPSMAFVLIGFFALIGVAVYITQSALPLWALVFTPSFSQSESDDEDDN